MLNTVNGFYRAILCCMAAALVCVSAQAEPRVRPAEWAQPVIGTELVNFYKVNDEVYRSSQPDEEQLPDLESLGIHSMLSLREYHNDKSVNLDSSMELFRVPMNAGEIDDHVVGVALEAIAKAKKPILVHCWHGSDRTGAIIAMYRMVFENWPRDKAIDEFLNGGYGYHRNVYPGIEGYLQSVDIDKFKARFVSTKAK